MKWYCLLILSLCVYEAGAQNVAVTVSASGEPLGYSYVFVNDNFYSSADSMGMAFIPSGMLNEGDTVSASFVGYGKEFAIYDSTAMAAKRISIGFPAAVSIENIVISGKDPSWDYFRKYVKKRSIGTWYDKVDGSFSLDAGDSLSFSGSFTYAWLPRDYKAYTGEKELLISIGGKEVGHFDYGWMIRYVYRMAVGHVALNRTFSLNRDMTVKYMGKKDGFRLFFVIRPVWLGQQHESTHTLLYVDERTREITKVEYESVVPGDAIAKVALNAKYHRADYYNENPRSINPYEIEANMVGVHGKRYDIRLNGMRVSRYNRTKLPKGVEIDYRY